MPGRRRMPKLPKPFSEWTTYDGHSGIDFPQREGTPIPALGDGVVTFVGWNKDKPVGDRHSPGRSAGNSRCINFGGVEVRFCHLENLTGPKVGDRVTFGDSCGPVGETGLASGPHVHMEVWVNGVIQKGAAFWRYVDNNKTAPKPALAGTDSEEFDMPLTDQEKREIAVAVWSHTSPGYEKSTGGPIPDEKMADRVRKMRAHTNDLQTRMNRQDAQLAALTAAVKTLASVHAVDPKVVEAAIDKAVKDALDGWTLTINAGEA